MNAHQRRVHARAVRLEVAVSPLADRYAVFAIRPNRRDPVRVGYWTDDIDKVWDRFEEALRVRDTVPWWLTRAARVRGVTT